MKKERIIASKKIKTLTKPKLVINLCEDLPMFSSVSNVDLENLNSSTTARPLSTSFSANQRVKRFSESSH